MNDLILSVSVDELRDLLESRNELETLSLPLKFRTNETLNGNALYFTLEKTQ